MSSTSGYTHYAVFPSERSYSVVGAEQAFPRSYSRISWGAVLAGTAVAIAMSLLLDLFGLALGIGLFHGAGIWLILSTLIAMAIGGYVAGRLAGTFNHLDSELHGLTVWAFTVLVSAFLLTRLVSAEVSATTPAAVSLDSGATAAMSADQGEFARLVSPQGLVDRLRQSLNTGGDPSLMTREQINAEIGLLINRRLANGAFVPVERDRLIALVAQRDGLNREEATLRVSRMEQEADGAAIRARSSMENASLAVSSGARGVGASLLLGLAAALLGAWWGTRHVRRIVAEVHEGHQSSGRRVDYGSLGPG